MAEGLILLGHIFTTMHNKRYAILIDGGYLKEILKKSLGQWPKAEDIRDVADKIQKDPLLKDIKELLRVYYYDAPPLSKEVKNPLDGTKTDYSKLPGYKAGKKYLESLCSYPDFAVRQGVLQQHNWVLKDFSKASGGTMSVTATDIKPEIKQKGVDLRIGLDVATMAIRGTVDTIVMVTGDTDLMPALKLARKEGLRVYMVQVGSANLHPELICHSDNIIKV